VGEEGPLVPRSVKSLEEILPAVRDEALMWLELVLYL
jgi:hypothetical protein